MLHSLIGMSKIRNNVAAGDARRVDDSLTDLRPLGARSLALSVLLGMHPPALPVAKLTKLGELFGIEPGTMRTALSRLRRDGTLELADTRYRLVGPLLDRQRSQDLGRRALTTTWSGRWHTIVPADRTRPLEVRRAFRTRMENHRFGELRPEIWMRPANIDPPSADSGVILVTGSLDGRDANDLAGTLWDLPAIGRAATILLDRCEAQIAGLDWSGPSAIVPSFHTAAATLRLLRRDPLLPAELQPPGWAPDRLRIAYAELERLQQDAIARFLRDDRTT